MAGVLEGIKVLDLASMWAAPSCAMYLADHGADVIKVEPPQGDESRRLFTHTSLGNERPSFLAVNRNKRGIVLDLRKAEALEIARKLAQQSDVVIVNFRPQVAQRLRLRYEDLEPRNPRLIYVELSAYGKKGPYAHKAGYDLLFQAMSGMLHRRLPDGTPLASGIWAVDCSTPIMLAYGVTLALLARERTGRGQKIETSLLHMAIAMQFVDLVKPEVEPPGKRAPSNQATFAPYRCADGKWIVPVAISDKEWRKLCQVLELRHLIDDPAFASPHTRAYNNDLFPLLAGVFETKPRDEWLRLLHEADVPCAPVADRSEVYTQPQMVANEMFAEVHHPTAGRTLMMSVPLRLSSNPGSVRRPSPIQGQHTGEVLKELGYNDATIARLKKTGTVA